MANGDLVSHCLFHLSISQIKAVVFLLEVQHPHIQTRQGTTCTSQHRILALVEIPSAKLLLENWAPKSRRYHSKYRSHWLLLLAVHRMTHPPRCRSFLCRSTPSLQKPYSEILFHHRAAVLTLGEREAVVWIRYLYILLCCYVVKPAIANTRFMRSRSMAPASPNVPDHRPSFVCVTS